MAFTKETKWFCENASSLEKFSGQWIGFSVDKGLVSKGESIETVMPKSGSGHGVERHFVFHVPSKDDLQVPRHILKS